MYGICFCLSCTRYTHVIHISLCNTIYVYHHQSKLYYQNGKAFLQSTMKGVGYQVINTDKFGHRVKKDANLYGIYVTSNNK